MELTKVESSHIDAIGYLEADRVLLVRYDDGGLYAWPGVSAAQWNDLVANPSKGAWLSRLIRHSIGIPIAKANDGLRERTQDTVAPKFDTLNVLDPDVSKCCRKLFLAQGANVNDKESFTCSDCGTQVQAEMQGAHRFWRIVPLFAVHRKAR